MAYIHFNRKAPSESVVVVGINEKFVPNKKTKELCKRIAELDEEIEIIEALIEDVNKKICPNWDEFKKNTLNE